ncbi:hypothetical protein Areg01_41660 [Actinoplanes regularis]|nr:hypothetical protein Areg01_41660 [Actinoplanes regularis]
MVGGRETLWVDLVEWVRLELEQPRAPMGTPEGCTAAAVHPSGVVLPAAGSGCRFNSRSGPGPYACFAGTHVMRAAPE